MSERYKIWIAVPGMAVSAHVMENLSLGGSESAGAYLALGLAERGHDVTVFANIPQPDFWRGVKLEPLGEQSERWPVGQNLIARAQCEPHDCLIVQRHPAPFSFIGLSKVKFWWVHDLARARFRGVVKANAWNHQGVLAVSAWHKAQVQTVYALPQSFVHALPNSIDLSLFGEAGPDAEAKRKGKRLLYTSRPERGLENLVRPGGIMAKLAQLDPEVLLLVATYDNAAPEMVAHYAQLHAWARALPNVELLPPQNKRDLARLMGGAALLVYPTVPSAQHEATSCISLMEAQAAGTPFVVCDGGAVRETVQGGTGRGTLVPYKADGQVDAEAFLAAIRTWLEHGEGYVRTSAACREFAQEHYGYAKPAAQLETLLGRTLGERSSNPVRLVSHLYEQGDILAAKQIPLERVTAYIAEQEAQCGFLQSAEAYAAHYERSAELFHKYNPGLDARPLDATRVLQFQPNTAIAQAVAEELQRGPGRVLDYGCNIGQLALALAARWPQSEFVGVDISQRNIATARAQAEMLKLSNVKFFQCAVPAELDATGFDIVLCAETLEHVREAPGQFMEALEAKCRPGGLMLVSVPASMPDAHMRAPGEEERLEHVRFIDWQEAQELWGAKPGFGTGYFAMGQNARTQMPLSGALFGWRADGKAPGAPDAAARLVRQAPRETLGGLVVCRGADKGIERTLRSIAPICTEIVCGIDTSAEHDLALWEEMSVKFPQLKTFTLSASPLAQGFDAARNEVLDRLTADWVLWIDSDEMLCYGERLLKYLQPNAYIAYGIAQHHLSMEPPGLLRTDYPCRLFRRGGGLRFFGVVHEHPCYTEEKPPEHVFLVSEGVCIEHPGYRTEQVRRERFMRNLPLMRRDRERYPNRPLGAYLWCRDLLHLARFEAEQRGGRLTAEGAVHCAEALRLFHERLSANDTYLVLEMLPYASDATRFLHGGGGVEFRTSFDARGFGGPGAPWGPQGQQQIQGYLPDAASVEKLLALLAKARLAPFAERYL